MVHIKAVELYLVEGTNNVYSQIDAPLFEDNIVCVTGDEEIIKLLKAVKPKGSEVKIAEYIFENSPELKIVHRIIPSSINKILEAIPAALESIEDENDKNGILKLHEIITKFNECNKTNKFLLYE